MLVQFIGKPFWITFAALAAVFGLAVLVFQTPLVLPVMITLAILTFCVTLYRLEFGLAIAFAELFANSHGHLLFAPVAGFSLSLRMAVFGSVMAGWLVLILMRKAQLSLRDTWLTPFLALAGAVAIGFVIGLLQNDPRMAFDDGNAYLYIAYLLPILSVRWDATKQRILLQVLAASAAWVAVVTLGLLYIFTHFPEWMLVMTYKFIRDTRTGELTKMGGIFRIFLQAQFSVVVMFVLLSTFFWLNRLARSQWFRLLAAVSLASSVILISLSRSFWVGLIAGGACLLVLSLRIVKPDLKSGWKAIGSSALGMFGGMLLLVAVILFPFPYRTGSLAALTGLLSSRTTEIGDVAISSRWNLLPEMLTEIREAPLLGKGFGEEVTFKTDDPRARVISPDGTWTTYAFEWGWLEVWLKLGIPGLVAFGWIFVVMARGLWPYLAGEQRWIGLSFLSSLVMLYATHAFSPYLNHPLGLGLLLFFVPFLKQKQPAEAGVEVAEASVVRIIQPSAAPLISE